MTSRRRIPAFYSALCTRRTWAELLYALLGLPLGIAGFVFTVVTVSVSGALFITFVGVPLMVATGYGARQFGVGNRLLANALLGANVPALPRLLLAPGLSGWLKGLWDPSVGRARVYLLLKLPLGIASFVVAVVFYSYGLGGITYWIWRPFLPCNDHSTVCHRGAQLWSNHTLDSSAGITLVAVIGLVMMLLAPWAVRAVVAIDKALVRALLGPTQAELRVVELEQTRAHAVDDSAATLRRIERDLHDGTQARLVALAMNIGLAKEKLAEGADPAEARRLLESAHTTAKDAIVELRNLARGIHPPVLDAGLDTALATLAAHSAVPVQLRTSITARPDPSIETIAYFCAAELITNVAKHSGASRVVLDARTTGSVLRLQVTDDGRGGAHLGAAERADSGAAERSGGGSGLIGLSERVRTVDGRLGIDSPDGGPTVITVELPLTSRAN
ncbi:MAG: sensor domain-containing protein [Jatrophihabitantaceae bacterium]